MSAVFGFWNLDGKPADPTALCAMSATLAHRGSDDEGVCIQGPLALGHRAFRTTPESCDERQPFVVDGGALLLAADLRVDNREELADALGLPRAEAARIPDGELALRGYRQWEERLPERLLGDFAIVVWDRRRQTLVCVRDHFGVRPLYYHHAPGRFFAFASEIKALFALAQVPRDVDDFQIAKHLLVPVPDDLASTYYRAVRRVLPGHTLAVTAEEMRPRRYWSLDPSRELRLSSDGEYAEAVRATFTEAVRCRLRATTPVASMLSGGLDTSSIVCVATRLLEDAGAPTLHTLSAIYPDVPVCDESRFIRAVHDQCRVKRHFFKGDSIGPLEDLDSLNWHGDGANVGPNLYIAWHLYRMASAEGVRVVLEGYDGDSTISHGMGYLNELTFGRRWLRLTRTLRSWGHVQHKPWKRAAWQRFMGLSLVPALRRTSFYPVLRAVRYPIRETRRTQPLRQPAWRRSLRPDFAQVVAAHAVEPVRFRTERENHHHLLMRAILLHTLGWLEATGRGARVEVRFPFFDVRLAELCLSLPPEQKLDQGWTRMVMRRAMAGILPDVVRWRAGKSDLSPAIDHALRTMEQDRFQAMFDASGGDWQRYLDPAFLRALQPRFLSAETTVDENLAYWRALSLALWLSAAVAECHPDGGEVAAVC